MMRRVYLPFVLSLVFLVSCTAQNDPQNGESPQFNVTPGKPEDSIVVALENGVTVFDVQSVSGIGSATVELVSGSMPKTVIVRLHTKGLEEFRLSYEETVVAVSVPSGDGFGNASESLLTPEGETPITALHPSWLEVKVVSDQAAPKIPLENGYFEITLPKGLGASFEISWVDFFRQ